MTTLRPIIGVADAVHTLEGAGFEVTRPFPTGQVDLLDPFLLLDEMGPTDHPPGSAKGAPDHPHRGFETVTYLLEGEFEHADSAGNRGVITPGAVQWMTAGAGVVHAEMPSEAFQRTGGRLHGFQLWVNLPSDAKRIPPRYQRLDADAIPVVTRDGATVRVVAGSFGGIDGPGRTHSPVTYLHVSLAPGSLPLTVDPADDENVGVYTFRGRVAVNGYPVRAGQLAVAAIASGSIELSIDDRAEGRAGETAEMLVLAGRPLNEPVARYGPFVMNTREEIIEAIEDFQAGRMGAIAPVGKA